MLKTKPFGAAHTYMAYIWEYPPSTHGPFNSSQDTYANSQIRSRRKCVWCCKNYWCFSQPLSENVARCSGEQLYLRYSKGKMSSDWRAKEEANTLDISLCTSPAFHAALMETFPISPISASWALFSPLGIGIEVVSAGPAVGGRHTIFLVYGSFSGPYTCGRTTERWR